MTLPQGIDATTFSMMQTGEPYSVYRKTILGKVVVSTLSPFDNKKEEVLLVGDPRNDESAKIQLWSQMADVYFLNANKVHFNAGRLIKDTTKKVEVQVQKRIEQYSDEELKEVINLRYLPLQKLVSEIESAATLYRMVDLAREMEKSEKIVKVIESRLSAVQKEETPTPD